MGLKCYTPTNGSRQCDEVSAAPQGGDLSSLSPIKLHSHHYILRVGIIGEGAIIKHDLVERLGADLSDL